MLVEQRYEMTPVDGLAEHPSNPRRGNVEVIAESIEVSGFYGAVIAQRSTSFVLAGNHRLRAARQAGLDTLPVIWVDVDDEHARRILAVDNRANDLAGYDTAALAALLSDLPDLAGTGYGPDDLAALQLDDPAGGSGDGDGPEDDDAGDDVEPPAVVVSRPGDLWLLGDHRIVCGDCRDGDVVDTLLGTARVNLAFTSPPYADRRKYDEGSGFRPIPPDEYVEWFDPVQAAVRRHLADDGSWFVNIKAGATDLDTDLYVMDLVLAHVRRWGWHLATELCWRRNGMPKSVTRRFKNQFEPIYQFARGSWKMRPQAVMHATDSAIAPQGAGAGDTGWGDDMTQRGFDADRIAPGMAFPGNMLPPFATESTGHTAAFPSALPAWFMRAYTDPGDVVFDPFMGSGSTLLAAEREGRVAYGTELSPGYVDVICRRWQAKTGQLPVLAATGEPHSFLGDG